MRRTAVAVVLVSLVAGCSCGEDPQAPGDGAAGGSAGQGGGGAGQGGGGGAGGGAGHGGSGGTAGQGGSGGTAGHGGSGGTAGQGGGGGLGDASVTIRVSTLAGRPVEAASIRLGLATLASGRDGVASFAAVAPGRVVARVDAQGFVSTSVVIDLEAGVDATAEATLLAQGRPIPFRAEEGIAVLTDGVQVAIEPDSFVDAGGAPVTGPVQLTVAPIDPTTPAIAAAPPLDRIETDDDPLYSLFMADVTVWKDGTPVQLAPGKRVHLGFPVPPASFGAFPVGTAVPGWSFDLDAGFWREEALGSVIGDAGAGGVRWWIADVPHLSSWNADKRGGDGGGGTTGFNSVRVQVVEDGGGPIGGAFIVGIAGASQVTGTTGTDGEACIRVSRGATYSFTARARASTTDTVAYASPAGDAQCAADGAVTTLTLKQACISGRATLPDGTPIAGGTVTAIAVTSPRPTTSTTTTEADGSFCVGAPPFADVNLEIYDGLIRSPLASVLTQDPADCGDPGCSVIPDLVATPACLTGTVVDGAGNPRPGTALTARIAGTTVRLTSGADGTYCVDAQPGATVEITADNGATVLAPATGTGESCGGSSCGTIPELVVATSCVTGTVGNVPGGPASVGASVGGNTVGTGAVAADGSFCVELPVGPQASLTAYGSSASSGTPLATPAVLVPAGAGEGSCGGGGCVAAPPLAFESLTCVDVLASDDAGGAADGAILQLVYADAAGSVVRSAQVVADASGEACFEAPPATSVRVTAGARLGLGDGTSQVPVTPLGSTALVTSATDGLACGSGACGQAPITTPRIGCVDVTVTDAAGAAIDQAFTELRFEGIRGKETASQFTNGGGGACFELPQETDGIVRVGETWQDSGVAAVRIPAGPTSRCGGGACVAASLQTLPKSCLQGSVVDGLGVPPPQGRVELREDLAFPGGPNFVFAGGTANTDAAGAFCVDVPAGRPVTLAVRAIDDNGYTAGGAFTHLTTSSAPATCAAGGCMAVPQLTYDPAATGCWSGRAWLYRVADIPAPPGTPVYVFDINAGVNRSCDPGLEDPHGWGSVLSETTVGADGRFCLPVPLYTPDRTTLVLQIGGCPLVSGDAARLELFSIAPPAMAGACGSSCTELGPYVLLD